MWLTSNFSNQGWMKTLPSESGNRYIAKIKIVAGRVENGGVGEEKFEVGEDNEDRMGGRNGEGRSLKRLGIRFRGVMMEREEVVDGVSMIYE